MNEEWIEYCEEHAEMQFGEEEMFACIDCGDLVPEDEREHQDNFCAHCWSERVQQLLNPMSIW